MTSLAAEIASIAQEAGISVETIYKSFGSKSVVTPIRIMMRHLALTDHEIAAVLETAETERLARMRHHAQFLKARGHLRDGVTVSEATDLRWICSSLEIYELLGMRRGWSTARFARYVGNLMITALL